MAYEKRMCVLKQLKKGFSADGGSLSGVVYLERLGTELTITPRIAGLSPLKEGRYVLVLRAEGKDFFFEWNGETLKLSGAPSIKDGAAVLLCFVRGEAEAVAFGACGNGFCDHRLMLDSLLKEGRRKPLPTPMPPVQIPAAPAPNVPLAPGVPLPESPPEEVSHFRTVYNDEAIADGNYFPHALHEDEEGGGGVQGEETQAEGAGDPQKDAHDGFLFPRRTLTYYKEIREKIESVMKNYPPDTRLLSAFPHSEWVKSEGGLLGIVYEDGLPRYLCVAVEKKGDPPAEMKENCAFVPASPFTDSEGFYVVFQDADTGAYVKVAEG